MKKNLYNIQLQKKGSKGSGSGNEGNRLNGTSPGGGDYKLQPTFITFLVRPTTIPPLALKLPTILTPIRTKRAPALAFTLLRATLAAMPWAPLRRGLPTSTIPCRLALEWVWALATGGWG
jgi:hypothetical protein